MTNTTPPITPAPRAYRLDQANPIEAEAARETVTIALDQTLEAQSLATTEAALVLKPPSRSWRLAGVFGTAVAGLLGVAVYGWLSDMLVAAFQRSPWLGGFAAACAGLAGLALVVMLARFLRDVLRQRRIDGLRADAALALSVRSADDARRVAAALVALQAGRVETAANRARFTSAVGGFTDARDVITLAERELVEPLDRLAADAIARAARQVSLVTAVSPRALIDLIFVMYAGGKLIREVITIYGGRPGTLGLLRVGRASLNHLLITGGLAAGDAVVQQLIGQGLAARLSAKLGEGVLNGLMTARLGLAAMAVCRPLPFVETKPPTLGDVASGLLSGASKP